MSAPSSVPAGTVVAGRYRIERELGRGGMGAVYVATDLKFEAPVALKLTFGAINDDMRERFRREARIGHRLGQSPGFVRAIDWGQAGAAALYLAMDLVDEARPLDLRSGTLAERLRRLARAARVVGTAHRLGVIHRDLKPANFLVDREGQIRLADFGLAKLTGEQDPRGSSDRVELTRSGVGFGTPQFMAPEQFEEAKGVDARADVYALGVMMFLALTGRYPYEGSSFRSFVIKQERVREGREPGPRPRDHLPELPLALDELCVRALALDLEQRVATAHAFADELERLLPLLGEAGGAQGPLTLSGGGTTPPGADTGPVSLSGGQTVEPPELPDLPPSAPPPRPRRLGRVLACLGLLMALGGGGAAAAVFVVLPELAGARERALMVTARNDMEGIERALELHRTRHGGYPAELSELPVDLRYSLRDPWGQRYGYEREGAGYELVCLGADGAAGGTGIDADLVVRTAPTPDPAPQPAEPVEPVEPQPQPQPIPAPRGPRPLHEALPGVLAAARRDGALDRWGYVELGFGARLGDGSIRGLVHRVELGWLEPPVRDELSLVLTDLRAAAPGGEGDAGTTVTQFLALGGAVLGITVQRQSSERYEGWRGVVQDGTLRLESEEGERRQTSWPPDTATLGLVTGLLPTLVAHLPQGGLELHLFDHATLEVDPRPCLLSVEAGAAPGERRLELRREGALLAAVRVSDRTHDRGRILSLELEGQALTYLDNEQLGALIQGGSLPEPPSAPGLVLFAPWGEDQVTTEPALEVTAALVEPPGHPGPEELRICGQPAVVDLHGMFSARVPLPALGANEVEVTARWPGGAQSTIRRRVLRLPLPGAGSERRFQEPNESREQAGHLRPGLHQLWVQPADDRDWFQLEVPFGKELQVTAAFPEGPLPGVSLWEGGQRVGDWAGQTLRYAPTRTARVHLLVEGAGEPAEVPYALWIELRDYRPADRYEPNDHMIQARSLAAGRHEGLVCTGGGALIGDYYLIEAAPGEALTATIDFRHAEGDLDLQWLTTSGEVLAASAGMTDEERAEVVAQGPMVLRVYGGGGATPYALTVARGPASGTPAAPAGPGPDDAPEQARPLAPGRHEGLRTTGTADWYRVAAAPGSAFQVTLAFDAGAGDLDLLVRSPAGPDLANSTGMGGQEQARCVVPSEGYVLVLVYVHSSRGPVEYALEVEAPPAGPPPSTDRFEPNDTLEQARDLLPGRHEGLRCVGHDYYRVRVPAQHDLVATFDFRHASGDLDVYLVDAAGAALRSSTGAGDRETIRWATAAQAATVFLHAYCPANDYVLTLELRPRPAPDSFEPNETREQARSVDPGDHTGLRCTGEDWYRLMLAQGELLRVQLDFVHAEGDLDLQVLDESGTAVASSVGLTDGERIEHRAPGKGLHWIRVYNGYNAYRMRIERAR